MCNLSFRLQRANVAETEAYAIAFLVRPGKDGDRVVMRSPRYLERLRKTNDGWRICDRVQTLDWSCEVVDLPLNQMRSCIRLLYTDARWWGRLNPA
jgi:hypothetical protein